MPIHQFYRCPYCPASAGVFAVDTGRLTLERPEERGGSAVVDLHVAPGRSAVVFNPDTTGVGPCPHVVAMLVEMVCHAAAPRGRWRRVPGQDADWTHPWFREHPLGRDVSMFLWENWDDVRAARLMPATSHVLERREMRLEAGRLRVDLVAQIILAGDVGAYLEQALDGAERSWRLGADRAR